MAETKIKPLKKFRVIVFAEIGKSGKLLCKAYIVGFNENWFGPGNIVNIAAQTGIEAKREAIFLVKEWYARGDNIRIKGSKCDTKK